uniref:Uncharacterized protein n=1 Tax=Oryza punctata TaxID=4537 RepID=A0A0E0LJN9_ORYPU
MPHARPHMIPQMTPDVPTSHWQGGFAPFAGTSQGIPTIPRVEAEFIGQGEFTSLGGPTQSVPLHAPTYGTNPCQGQSMYYGGTSFGGGVQDYMDLLQQGDWLFGQYSSHRNEIPYIQAPSTGSFRPELMSEFRPYTASLHRTTTCPASVEGHHRYPMSFGLRKLMMRPSPHNQRMAIYKETTMTRIDLTVSAMSQTVCHSQVLDMPQEEGKKLQKSELTHLEL